MQVRKGEGKIYVLKGSTRFSRCEEEKTKGYYTIVFKYSIFIFSLDNML